MKILICDHCGNEASKHFYVYEDVKVTTLWLDRNTESKETCDLCESCSVELQELLNKLMKDFKKSSNLCFNVKNLELLTSFKKQ